jgi:pimeloyl-ACP methyl ester carboxylesterase
LILIQFISIYISYRLFFPKRVSTKFTIEDEIQKGEITPEFLKTPKEEFILKSDMGYDLSGFFIKGKSNNTVIFCHGIAWTKYGSVKYMDSFLKKGWNIIAYDHRGCGESGGEGPSYGFYEKLDLEKIIQFANQKFPKTNFLGLYGESMGASTILQYSRSKQNLKFIIAVCPFSNLVELIRFHLQSSKIPSFIHKLILYSINIYSKLLQNFSIYDVNPLEDVLTNQIPLFLAHGFIDKITPFSMSEEIYNRRKNSSTTTLFIGENSGHTPEIYMQHRDEFEKKVWEFISKLQKSKSKKSPKKIKK